MDSTTRDQVFAAKERLQQLTQVTRKDLEWEAEQDRREEQELEEKASLRTLNKAKMQTEKEKALQERKVKESDRNLNQLDKSVTSVLSQAAKVSNTEPGESEGEEEEVECDHLEDISVPSDSDHRTSQQKHSNTGKAKGRKADKGKGKDNEPKPSDNRGKSSSDTHHLDFVLPVLGCRGVGWRLRFAPELVPRDVAERHDAAR